MLTKLLTPLLAGPISKLIRHGLALLTGWLATHGLEISEISTSSILAALLAWVALSVWSFLVKAPAGTETRGIILQAVSVLAANLVPLLAGVFSSHGFSGDSNSPEAILIWGLSWIVSALDRPDARPPTSPGLRATPVSLILLFFTLPVLLLSSGCAAAKAPQVSSSDWTLKVCIGIPIGKIFGKKPGNAQPDSKVLPDK